MNGREYVVFSGRANPSLTREICNYLATDEGAIDISTFSDGEIYVQICENVRGRDVFVVQPTCPPVNENLMELLIIVDALKRSSASRITAVVPYYGYARQDRKDKPRVPITAKLVADLFMAAGVDRVLAMDLHAGQLQGFFNIPVDNLFAAPVLLEYIRKQGYEDLMIISPDAGGFERARSFANRLGAMLGIINKRRDSKNVSHVLNIIGEVKGKNLILLDDMIDTGGTIVNAAHALLEKGARSVRAYCTHPVFSGKAVERLREAPLEEIVVTDTIPLSAEARNCKKFTVLTVAYLLGEAIRRIHSNDSVSSLFI